MVDIVVECSFIIGKVSVIHNVVHCSALLYFIGIEIPNYQLHRLLLLLY
jgi:hypothetical protein